MANLTARQHRFVEEYLVDLNATQAALRAGYSPKTARQAGSENLSKPAISEAVADAQAARSERTEVTQDWVVQRLAAEATATGKGTTQAARVNALAHLGRHLGMFDGTGHGEGGSAGPFPPVTGFALVPVQPRLMRRDDDLPDDDDGPSLAH